MLKMTIRRSRITCFPVHQSSYLAKKRAPRVARTSIWLISSSGELCNKNHIVKSSETFD